MFYLAATKTWYYLKRFLGTKWHNIHVWYHLNRFPGTFVMKMDVDYIFRSIPIHSNNAQGFPPDLSLSSARMDNALYT